MNKIIDDVAALTSISVNSLAMLNDRTIQAICHCVYEGILEGNNPIEMELGFGTLYIKYEGDEIKYKFIPSKKLEESVSRTVQTKTSPIVQGLDAALKERIENTYKDLL